MTTAPKQIRVSPDRQWLTLVDDDGEIRLPAEYLRVESPSAEVQGHGPNERQIIGGKRQVQITRLAPVGNYAIRITFSDGHDTGLYTWDYLRTISRERSERFQTYLDGLKARGLTRD